mgnify:CR=1 FL=1
MLSAMDIKEKQARAADLQRELTRLIGESGFAPTDEQEARRRAIQRELDAIRKEIENPNA